MLCTPCNPAALDASDPFGREALVSCIPSGDAVDADGAVQVPCVLLGLPARIGSGEVLLHSRADGVDLGLVFAVGVGDLGEATFSGADDCSDVFLIQCVHGVLGFWFTGVQSYSASGGETLVKR